MFWDRHTIQVIAGLTALVIGGAWLLQDAGGLLAPVGGMVVAVWAVSLGNQERLKLRIAVLEKRLAQAECGYGSSAPRKISRAGSVPSSGRKVRRLIFQPSSVRTNSQRLAETRCTWKPRDEP